MRRRLFRHKRRADNGLVTAEMMSQARNVVRFWERMKDNIASMSPELMLREAREFGLLLPERAVSIIQRAFFKHTVVTPTLAQLLSTGGPTSLPGAYKYYAESLVRPERIVAYMKGSGDSFRGHLRIEQGEGRLKMVPHPEDLKVDQDELVRLAVEEDRIYYVSRRGIRSLERSDLARRILFEPGFFEGDARMVIPFDRKLGLLDVEGPDITFGNLILPHSAAITTGLVLSKLVSMKMVSELDLLTGLFTRRAYEDLMNYFAEVYLETGQDMSLLMFDIDHFKKVNDTYGHGTGDDVLARAASVAVTTLRTSDVVARAANGDDVTNGKTLARYGGEEFAILLPGANPDGASIAAGRCREAVQATTVRAPNGEEISITISMGIAAFSDARRVIEKGLRVPGVEGSFTSADMKGSLIWCVKSLADTALYRAKGWGRDMVVKVVTEGVGKSVDFEKCD